MAPAQRTRASAALLKGVSLGLMATWVMASTIYHTLILGLPSAELMGGIGVLALAANLASVLLLLRYKDGDANVRSVWLCSRNDAIGNVVVMIAALGVLVDLDRLARPCRGGGHGRNISVVLGANTQAGLDRISARRQP